MFFQEDDLSFGILCADALTQPDGHFAVRARPFAAIAFRLEGSAAFTVGERRVVSAKGDVTFVPAHTAYAVDYSAGKIIYVHLTDCAYKTFENVSPRSPYSLRSEFEELLADWKATHNVNGAKSAVYAILRSLGDDTAAVGDSAFEVCLSYLNEHAYEPSLSLRDVCRAGFISESGLRRRFFAAYGMTPKQYLLNLRMSKAIPLLYAGKVSVREAAALSGFADEKYFSRYVKSRYWIAPSGLCAKR